MNGAHQNSSRVRANCSPVCSQLSRPARRSLAASQAERLAAACWRDAALSHACSEAHTLFRPELVVFVCLSTQFKSFTARIVAGSDGLAGSYPR